MKAIVDRIENNTLVLELDDGTKAELPQKAVPNAKEGDVITFCINKDITESRKKQMDERVRRLWKD